MRIKFSAKRGSPLHLFFLLVIGLVAYKVRGKHKLNTHQAKENLRVKFSLLFSQFWHSHLPPNGEFSSFKTYPIRFFVLTSGVDHFRRCSSLDTAGLLQPSAKDKRTKGGQCFKNQSKLLELSLNF